MSRDLIFFRRAVESKDPGAGIDSDGFCLTALYQFGALVISRGAGPVSKRVVRGFSSLISAYLERST